MKMDMGEISHELASSGWRWI